MSAPIRTTTVYILSGWGCLLLSSLFFYVGTQQMKSGSILSYTLLLMLARILGLGGFVAGAISIFNKHWIHGALLFISSIALPIISLVVRGEL